VGGLGSFAIAPLTHDPPGNVPPASVIAALVAAALTGISVFVLYPRRTSGAARSGRGAEVRIGPEAQMVGQRAARKCRPLPPVRLRFGVQAPLRSHSQSLQTAWSHKRVRSSSSTLLGYIVLGRVPRRCGVRGSCGMTRTCVDVSRGAKSRCQRLSDPSGPDPVGFIYDEEWQKISGGRLSRPRDVSYVERRAAYAQGDLPSVPAVRPHSRTGSGGTVHGGRTSSSFGSRRRSSWSGLRHSAAGGAGHRSLTSAPEARACSASTWRRAVGPP